MENQIQIPTVEEIKFAGSTAKVNLETLSNTTTHLQVSGQLPKSRPIHHFQFVDWIRDEFSVITGKDTVVEQITITKSHSRRIRMSVDEVINPNDPCPIKALNVERLVTRIYLPETDILGADELTPAIAVGYNEKGLEVAYGTNVWACANMNIFGSRHLKTYGEGKVPFEVLRDGLISMMNQWDTNFSRDKAAIRMLQETEISIDKVHQMTGKLFENAVEFNNRQRDKRIFTTGQCIRLQEELLKKYHSGNAITAWDFTQAGTENLKPDSVDLTVLLPAVKGFNDFVLNENNLTY